MVDGDIFRWNWMWGRIAAWFGLEPSGFDGTVRPLRYQWYETDLHEERGASTWMDAERGFALASMRSPTRSRYYVQVPLTDTS